MKSALSFVALATAASALPAAYVEANHDLLWASFKSTYNKKYSGADEVARKAIFKKNMLRAAQLEKENPQAQFGVNAFSDLSEEEFKAYHNLNNRNKVHPPSPAHEFSAEEVKAATPIDWRTKGAVTHVKNQGQCGSCWSFSTTGNIEGQNFLANGNLVSLSEQELVSCSKLTDGCNGGWQDDAFKWLETTHNGAIVTEEAYAYTSGHGSTGTCKYTTDMEVGATISAHADVARDEDQMAAWVSKRGPLAIVIDATSWQTYSGGVMSKCISREIDHAVLAVGFTDDYWIVKNSWGTSWGESGYIRLQRGTNQCLITYRPTSSTVKRQ